MTSAHGDSEVVDASGAFALTFHGVRGSTPCHGPDLVRYGGNTSCVSLAIDGANPILIDLGTGLRYFGNTLPAGEPFTGTCLLSHLHWDHIQGLPFFAPLLQQGSTVDLYGPVQEGDDTLESVFADTIRPPLFPVDLSALPGTIRFTECWESDFTIDGCVDVKSRPIRTWATPSASASAHNGVSVAYLSDHQMPIGAGPDIVASAIELCRDVDLVIHDAQYTPAEFAGKSDWGHCTIEYAVMVAARSGARRLALFHHDPTHDDATLDRLTAGAQACGRELAVDVFAAREGDTVHLGA